MRNKSNVSVWNWSNLMAIWPALWKLSDGLVFNTRWPVTTVLSTNPCISSCLCVKNGCLPSGKKYSWEEGNLLNAPCNYINCILQKYKWQVMIFSQLIFQILTLLQNIYTVRASKCLALIMVRAYGVIWRLGAWVPLRLRHFLSQKLRHFQKNICSWVENELYCSCTVQLLTLLQNIMEVFTLSMLYFLISFTYEQ